MSAAAYKQGRGSINVTGPVMDRLEKVMSRLGGGLTKVDVVRNAIAVLEHLADAQDRGARVLCQEWDHEKNSWGPAVEWKALL